MPFQNLKLGMCWNKLLKMLRKSYRQQLNFQCVFRPVSEFTSNLLHRNSSNYRADLKILVLKSNLGNKSWKKPWLRETMIQEPQKCPPHSKRCLCILRVKCLSGCFGQQNFKPHSEHWTLWTLPFVFCLPISREERHLHSVQWSSPQCFLNWKFQNFLKVLYIRG